MDELMDQWRAEVLSRDGYTCQFPDCGANTHLEAHHLISRRNRELRYDPDNGVTVCHHHHQLLTHSPIENDRFHALVLADRLDGIQRNL